VGATLAIQLLIVYVPVLQVVFDTEPLSPVQLAVVLAALTAAFI
jgi:Cation transporting ATPase, C-terminus